MVFSPGEQRMATDTYRIPEEHGLETHGIERVSPKTRTHVRIRDNFTMWLSANLVISTIGLGALAIPVFVSGFGIAWLLLSSSTYLVFYPLPFSPLLVPNWVYAR